MDMRLDMNYLDTAEWPDRVWRDRAISWLMHTKAEEEVNKDGYIHITVEAYSNLTHTLWQLCEMANWCEEQHQEATETRPKPADKEYHG